MSAIHQRLLRDLRCQFDQCTEPEVVAYVNTQGRVVGHRSLNHYSDGSPFMPDDKYSWWPLKLGMD